MLPLSLMEMNCGGLAIRTAHGARQDHSATHQALGAAEDMRELEAGIAHRRRVDERGYLLRESKKHDDVSSRLPHAPRQAARSRSRARLGLEKCTALACQKPHTAMFAKHMR